MLLRRDRVQALRHLWLPARPDPGRGARQGAVGEPGRVRGRHEAPEGNGARGVDRIGPGRPGRAEWFAIRERLGTTKFIGYDITESHGRSSLALVAGGDRGRRGAKAGETRAGGLRPHALLCRERRPGRRRRRDRVGRRQALACSTPRSRPATSSCTKIGVLEGDARPSAHRGAAGGRRPTCARPRAPTTRPTHLPHAALRHVLGPRVSPEGPDGRRRAHPLRLQPGRRR